MRQIQLNTYSPFRRTKRVSEVEFEAPILHRILVDDVGNQQIAAGIINDASYGEDHGVACVDVKFGQYDGVAEVKWIQEWNGKEYEIKAVSDFDDGIETFIAYDEEEKEVEGLYDVNVLNKYFL